MPRWPTHAMIRRCDPVTRIMGVMSRWCLLGVLAGCYAPSVPTGAPCATNADCPASLVCASSGTCERAGGCPGCDADVDVPPVTTCWDAWRAGTVVLGSPAIVAQLASNGADSNPSLADGDRTIYLTRAGLGGNDIFAASRQTPSGTFSSPQVVLELTSPVSDSRFTVSMDGEVGVLASERPPTLGASDLWYTTRDILGTFAVPTQEAVAALVDADPQFDPELSPDGLVLYYSHAMTMAQHLMVARRASRNAAFDMASVIELEGALPVQADPTVSPDERVLVFASGTSATDTDLYYATRATATGAFAPAKRLDISTPTAPDSDPELSADGCTLFFSSTRAPAQGRDIWIATVQL